MRSRNSNAPPRFISEKITGEKSIQYKGAQIWNSLPTEIQSCESLNIFKKSYKNFLIDNSAESEWLQYILLMPYFFYFVYYYWCSFALYHTYRTMKLYLTRKFTLITEILPDVALLIYTLLYITSICHCILFSYPFSLVILIIVYR